MDFNATEVMSTFGIRKIERVCGRFVVLLDDGRIGFGTTAGDALSEAQLPGAENVRRAA